MRSAAVLVFALFTPTVVDLAAQSITVSTVAGALRVDAPGFGFIEGPVLSQLRDGRSVRVDLDLAVLERPGGPTVTQARQSFALSFDLWEERFAVTRIGAPARSISHLSAKSAEAWCLDNVTIPAPALGRIGRTAPFWIRLAYRVQDPAPAADATTDEGLTLATLIDRLSRRRSDGQLGKSVNAGPFRLSN